MVARKELDATNYKLLSKRWIGDLERDMEEELTDWKESVLGNLRSDYYRWWCGFWSNLTKDEINYIKTYMRLRE